MLSKRLWGWKSKTFKRIGWLRMMNFWPKSFALKKKRLRHNWTQQCSRWTWCAYNSQWSTDSETLHVERELGDGLVPPLILQMRGRRPRKGPKTTIPRAKWRQEKKPSDSHSNVSLLMPPNEKRKLSKNVPQRLWKTMNVKKGYFP